MNRFIEAIRNMFRIEDLRSRVLFTLALLGVYRIGAHIPTPGINVSELERIFNSAAGSALGLFDLFSGGNFRQLTIFALGIMPYITASIILQLMQVVFPYLERLQKEGELGRQKITQYTRSQHHPVADDCGDSRIAAESRLPPRSSFRPDDRSHADHRLGVHHVAGRAD